MEISPEKIFTNFTTWSCKLAKMISPSIYDYIKYSGNMNAASFGKNFREIFNMHETFSCTVCEWHKFTYSSPDQIEISVAHFTGVTCRYTWVWWCGNRVRYLYLSGHSLWQWSVCIHYCNGATLPSYMFFSGLVK